MRITYISAGAGGSYCGACAHDVTLVRGFKERGHDVQMLVLYMPLYTDGPDPSLERVFFGGINAYLQQHFAVCRRTPEFVDWVLDRPALLKLVARFAVSTSPEDLGEMTVSVLRGEEGFQHKEVEKLTHFLAHQRRPDVVNLTNSLLAGLAPTIKQRLGVPVLSVLQGEESFIARLSQPHRDEATRLLRKHAQVIDLFVAPGEAYADEMSRFLAVPRDRIRVVRTGIDTDAYANQEARIREPFRIGFLSRISPVKGLDLLVDAFSLLERQRPGRAVLAVAGQMQGANRGFWDEQLAKLRSRGLASRLDYRGELTLEEKVKFFQSSSVFVLSSRTSERRAVACLEAQAAGVPVVVPDRGVFPEIVKLTGGGILVKPDDPQALTDVLAALRDDPERADRLGREGAAGVAKHCSSDGMVSRMLEVYQEVLSEQSAAAGESDD